MLLKSYQSSIVQTHGQFNNSLECQLPTKKHLEKLSSVYDLDLFCLNTDSNLNLDCNLGNQPARCQYFSPHSFSKFKNTVHNDQDCFSLFHNNIRSLKHNLENPQVHLLDELDYNFSVIGVTETKITRADSLNFKPNLPNYGFEYVPTLLSCGGVGIYISSRRSYNVIEKTSTQAFQALWIEIQFLKKTNIICGVIYWQHNSPNQFQIYFDEILEKLSWH